MFLWKKIRSRLPSPVLDALAMGDSRQRIRFLGDHSALHSGCRAVVDYLHAEIATLGRLVEKRQDYDLLVVNGEGSMHHEAPNHCTKMAAIAEALNAGKRVLLVNTVWQANSNVHDERLRQINAITVREVMSYNELQARHGIESRIHLDASYWAHVDETARFTDRQGATVMTDFYSYEFGHFVRTVGGPFRKYPYLDMSRGSWSSLVRELRSVSLLVTGRHHAVYAACRARTPFVALKGNTHKIEGMIRMSGLPIPICDKFREINDAITWARENRSAYDDLFAWMDTQPRLRLAELPGALAP